MTGEQVFPIRKNAKGQCVPAVAFSDEEPAVVSRRKTQSLAEARCCSACGGPMGQLAWFAALRRDIGKLRFGPNGRRNFHFLEQCLLQGGRNPPMHFECARHTVSGGCPVMSAEGDAVLMAVRHYVFGLDHDEDAVRFSARCVEARRIRFGAAARAARAGSPLRPRRRRKN
jgi:hypothetical protein